MHFDRARPRPPAQPRFPEVTVLLGDPRLPDRTKVEHRFSPEDFEAVERMAAALADLDGYHFRYRDDHTRLMAELMANPPTFVFNLCDTGYRNDAALELHVPALLEMLAIPYSGAGPTCLGLCYDKAAVRALADAHSIPVPRETYVRADADEPALPPTFPAILKPGTGDGSVGITKEAVVYSEAAARNRLRHLRSLLPERDTLVQEYLEGPEYAVGLVGNPGQGFTLLPPLAVDYSALDAGLPHILSYESKTIPSSPYWTQIRYHEAALAPDKLDTMVRAAGVLFARLGCRDYARFDFREGADGVPRLLEVNPNPAWCWDGKFNLMAGFAGLSYADLLRLILEAAQQRNAG